MMLALPIDTSVNETKLKQSSVKFSIVSDSDSLFNINMYNYILCETKKNINFDNYIVYTHICHGDRAKVI